MAWPPSIILTTMYMNQICQWTVKELYIKEVITLKYHDYPVCFLKNLQIT